MNLTPTVNPIISRPIPTSIKNAAIIFLATNFLLLLLILGLLLALVVLMTIAVWREYRKLEHRKMMYALEAIMDHVEIMAFRIDALARRLREQGPLQLMMLRELEKRYQYSVRFVRALVGEIGRQEDLIRVQGVELELAREESVEFARMINRKVEELGERLAGIQNAVREHVHEGFLIYSVNHPSSCGTSGADDPCGLSDGGSM
ncbi:hypothetical protein K470DRAFT_269459 [Piedraia hortae CBS 480.64]|uniref:Uncharacterized protein n=1 Tax=Piedraia hortae CBS 480.64 TaxID=1314780 RepID=A0A6A7C3W8_9PEZI|nr:hypothetical protein K470DRAFT_269459 [Piedraia hortae CBS 480.64]